MISLSPSGQALPSTPRHVSGAVPAAQKLWEQGEQQAAIDVLLQAINAAPQAVPKALGLQLAYYVFLLGDLKAAEQFLHRLLSIHPDDLEILENLAVVISRQSGRGGDAIPLYQRVCQLRQDSANAWDGLASALARTGNHQQAQEAGERALQLKTETAQPLPGWAPPPGSPQTFLQRPGTGQRHHCISFSIWGANPRYLRGALRNALLIPELYPGWQARFHLDASVPEELVEQLQALGAAVHRMPTGQSLRQKLCWRFLVANDPAVGRFLVRDCDSVVNQREVNAVQQWLASDCWFHVMRDWWTHTDPILAGMWGGIAGVLPDLQGLLQTYKPAALETANVDQWFLRDVLWGSIHPHALIHDRCFRSAGSQPWPVPDPPGDRHVGQDEFSVNRAGQATWLAPWIRRTPCLQLADAPSEPTAPAALPPLPSPIIHTQPGPLPQQPPPMEALVSGRIINLDSAQERWRQMQSRVQALGWSTTHQRHPAQTASMEEAKALGLRNGGELGLWSTTLALLEAWLATDPPADAVLHVLEDDAVPNPNLPLLLDPLRQADPPLHILFTEAFLSLSLYKRLRALERERQASAASLLLLDGGLYLACTSSYLLTRNGAERLLEAMRHREATGRLVPFDMALRDWIRQRHLNAALTLPFFSTINPHTPSSLQSDRPAPVHLSQNADLALRRLLYSLSWDAPESAEVLNELSGLLADGLPSEQIEGLILEILGAGRAEGWLPRY